jgi:nicotinamide-nucleotide amidase
LKIAEILTIGDEVLIGDVINTNAAFIGAKLTEIGIYPEWNTVVRDESSKIVQALSIALQRADCIIITGGLGPTHDDITKKTIADFLKLPLVLDQEVLDQINLFFQSRGRLPPSANNIQAMIPEGALVLKNHWGTAPGIFMRHNNHPIIMLPGVPFEMRNLMNFEVVPRLRSIFSHSSILFKTIHTIGISESALYESLTNLSEINKLVQTAFLPKSSGIDIRLSAFAESEQKARENLDTAFELARSNVESWIYSIDNQTLEEIVGDLLRIQNKTIAIAESCTGGLISSKITDVPGSSDYMLLGVVSYSNRAKMNVLNVPEPMLKNYGAVSPEVASVMASSIRDIAGSDIGLSATGIAGPDGGSEMKPVGLVYLGLSDGTRVINEKFVFGADRLTNKIRFAQTGLDLLRRYLLKRI